LPLNLTTLHECLFNNENAKLSLDLSTFVSDNTVYAFMVENPNGSNVLHQDLEQIHEDDLEAIDLKWQLSLLSVLIRVTWLKKSSDKKWSNAFFRLRGIQDKTCSKTCLKNYKTLKKQCDDLLVKLNEFEFKAATYKRGLATLEDQIITYKKNEVLFSKEVAVLKREVGCKNYKINVLKSELEKVKQEKDGIDFKIKKFDKASKDLDQLLGSQITDKSKKGLGYSAVPPPHPLIYNRPNKLDLSYSGLDEFKEPELKGYGPENSKQESNVVCEKESDNSKENYDESLVKEQVSQDKSSFVESLPNVDKETVFPANKKVEFTKPENHEKPVRAKPQHVDKGFVHLEDVHMVVKLLVKGTLKHECLVLSQNFKLPDENQILLRIPREDNMYSFNMKNIVPKESTVSNDSAVNSANPDVNTGSLKLNVVGPSVSTASPNEEDSTKEEPEDYKYKEGVVGLSYEQTQGYGASMEVVSFWDTVAVVGDEAVHKELGDRMERAATTASSLEAEQDSGSGPRCQDTILGDVNAQTRVEITSKQSIDPLLSNGYTLGSGEDSMTLIGIDGKFLQAISGLKRVYVTESSIRRDLYLDDAEGTNCLPTATIFEELACMDFVNPFHTKKVFANIKRAGKDFSGRITPLRSRSLTSRCARSTVEEMGEDSDHPTDFTQILLLINHLHLPNQGRKQPSKKAQSKGRVDETQEKHDDDLMFDTGVLEDDEMHVEAKVDRKDEHSTKPDDSTAGEAVTTASVDDSAVPITIEEITLAQTLIQIKAAKPKVITTAATTTTTSKPKDKGVVVQEPSEFRVPQET
ncbi:hypothetical protein Tco_0590692, partial [Tanacetum coccineum]